jgi:hypothetical protein
MVKVFGQVEKVFNLKRKFSMDKKVLSVVEKVFNLTKRFPICQKRFSGDRTGKCNMKYAGDFEIGHPR